MLGLRFGQVLSLRRATQVALAVAMLLAAGPRMGAQAAGGLMLSPPQGFIASARFAGFEAPDIGASILVAEQPRETYVDMIATVTNGLLAGRGIEVRSRGILPQLPLNHIYIRATQDGADGAYEKFMLIVELPQTTAVVTANIPRAALDSGEISIEAIEASLRSIADSTERRSSTLSRPAPLAMVSNP